MIMQLGLRLMELYGLVVEINMDNPVPIVTSFNCKSISTGNGYTICLGTDGTLKAFKLFEKRFPDDSGAPFHNLQWTLALYKNEKYKEAEAKLIATMFRNLYLVPYIFGEDIPPYEIKHFSNFEEKEFIEYLPEEYLNLWDSESKEWAKSVYYKPETIQLREKYIELEKLLSKEPVGERRNELVRELRNLKNI